MPTVAPVRGILTSGFGSRRDPVSGRRASHLGVDIATAPGREVVAPAAGLVVQAGRIGGLGKAVYLSHGYGVTTRYGHLSSISVTPGQRVAEGETLGLVGSTGKSTGYHLHYEVRENGKPKNPIYYLLDWPRANSS
jgi:murein DD-endopeptidase MepM/ murein hydrolase activator NlpD